MENMFLYSCFLTLFVLMAGLTQFSDYILQYYRPLHRIIGHFYVINILAINFPCAMVRAIYANGGLPGKTAFVILDLLWFTFTLKAVLEAKKGNIRLHKQHMMRSYALTFSAISLRTWKIILVNTTLLDLQTIYIMDAWLGFLPNLLLAEIVIRRKRLKGI